MQLNQSYLESVKRVYKTLTINELMQEYFAEFGVTEEAKLVILEIFRDANITLEQAYIKHKELVEQELLQIEDKTVFPSIKIIGSKWFYDDWIATIDMRKKYGWDLNGIETIEAFYAMRSLPISKEEQAKMDLDEDAIQTMIHYGKFKVRK